MAEEIEIHVLYNLQATHCATFRTILLFGGISVLWMTIGCRSSNLGKVSGKVTYKGKPVNTGKVVFTDAGRGISMTATLGEDGTYVVQTAKGFGLPAGDYVVTIFPPPPTPAAMPPTTPGAIPKAQEPPDFPKKYRDEKTSGLSASVKQGNNEFNFDMTD